MHLTKLMVMALAFVVALVGSIAATGSSNNGYNAPVNVQNPRTRFARQYYGYPGYGGGGGYGAAGSSAQASANSFGSGGGYGGLYG